MKNNKKVALATLVATMMPAVVYAETASTEAVSKSLGDWVAIIAEILSVLCIVVFTIYLGKFISLKSKKEEEIDEKLVKGVKNGVVTTLIGVAICQAAIIVAQLCF